MLSDCFCSFSIPLPPSVQTYIFSSVVFFCFVVVVKSLSGRPPGVLVCAHTSYTRTSGVCERGEKTTQTLWVPGATSERTKGETASVCMQNIGCMVEMEKNHRRDPLRRSAAAHVTRGVRAAIYINIKYIIHYTRV